MARLASNLDLNSTKRTDATRESLKRQQRTTVKTCQRCSDLHLKCVYLPAISVCQRCEKTGNDCVQRSKTKFRFRKSWAPKHNEDQQPESMQARSPTSASSIARTATANDGLTISDHGGVIDATIIRAHVSDPSVCQNLYDDDSSTETAVIDHPLFDADLLSGYTQGRCSQSLRQESVPILGATIGQSRAEAAQDHAHLHRIRTESQSSYMSSGSPIPRGTDERTPRRILGSSTSAALPEDADKNASNRTPSSDCFLDDLAGAPRGKMSSNLSKALETHLLRYFIDNLAPWFDICDPCRHFAHVLPQRARESGPLRSALLTIAARDVSRGQKIQSPIEVGAREDHWPSDVTEELAMSYHNHCIGELLSLSTKPERLHDEDLLAAVILLRTDEEMLHVEKDQQLFLRIASLFIDAQLPSSLEILRVSPQFHHNRSVEGLVAGSLINADLKLNSDSLRQACFWTALRQDLHAAFLKQQPVSFPLKRCGAFRLLIPASDAVWAHRMVVFCADVIEYCFGSESVDGSVSPAYVDRVRWQKLQAYKQEMCALLPSSFEPMYCCEPNISQGEVFPSILYLEPSHVSGITYIELAALLLETYNPIRSKLAGALLHPSRAFLASIKKILFRLCGIAISNARMCPPGLVNASLGNYHIC